MAKFYGALGYAETAETAPGVWEERIDERVYYGELVRNVRKLQGSGEVNDDVNIANEISVVADPFALRHFHALRYASYMGAKWKVLSVEAQYPRLILTIGGVYNDQPVTPT
jgi:hypothetical protein